MSVSTGTGRASAGARTDLPPYYERLEPIDGGYTLTGGDGRQIGEIRIFDDRAQTGVIHTQFSSGRGRFTKVATMRFESGVEFQDVIEALTLAEKQLP